MAVRTEKELNEMQRSHWLKAVAGNSQTGAGVPHGPSTIAAHGGNEEQIGKEKFFQYLDRADRSHEGTARNQKGPEACRRNAGKSSRRRTLPAPGESGFEG